MSFAIIRGGNGRRHEVDFKDDPVAMKVNMSESVVQISIYAIEDMAPSHKRRFATMAIPRDQLMVALSLHLRERKDRGEPARPQLVRSDE